MFDTQALEKLYRDVSAGDGLDLTVLAQRLDDLFADDRPEDAVQAYREGRQPWKRLREEVSPVVRLLADRGRKGHVRFPLDSTPPDAWFRHEGEEDWIAIEATGALSRARYELGRQLRDGMAPGFRGLANDRPQAEFDAARRRSRITLTPKALADGFVDGVAAALERKNDPRYAGGVLLISAPLESLPAHLREPVIEPLRIRAADLPFDQVFLQGDGANAPAVELHARSGLPRPI